MVKIPSNTFYIGIFKEHNYEEMVVVQPLELKILDLFLGLFKRHKRIFNLCTMYSSRFDSQNLGLLRKKDSKCWVHLSSLRKCWATCLDESIIPLVHYQPWASCLVDLLACFSLIEYLVHRQL
jgi:hypothetical protein